MRMTMTTTKDDDEDDDEDHDEEVEEEDDDATSVNSCRNFSARVRVFTDCKLHARYTKESAMVPFASA